MVKFQKAPFLTLSALLFFIPVVYASFSGIFSADLYWHLKAGEDFVFHGMSPWLDHYSVDFAGKPFINFTPLFDALSALFYRMGGGDQGLQWFRMVLLSLPLIYLVFLSRSKKAELPEFLWAISLITGCITFRKLIRPELCSYVFLMTYVLLLFAKEKKLKYLFYLIPLQWIWQYFHSTAVFGYVLCSGIYLNYLLDNLLVNRSWKRFGWIVLAGLITLAVGWLNPNGKHLLIQFTLSDSRWLKWIIELVHKSFFEREFAFQYLVVFSALIPLLALWRRNWGAALVLAIFIFSALKVGKVMPHLAILAGTIGLLLLIDWKKGLGKKFRWALNGVLLAAALAQSIYLVQNVFSKGFNPKPIPHISRFPVDIIDNLKSRNLRGTTINSYMMGGYLLHHLGPQLKVYIDGRTNILFPFEFFDTYVNAARDVDNFTRLDEKKNFDYVIGYLTHSNRVVDTALESGRFGLSEVGSQSVLLSRIEKSDFPVTSFYFRFPQCVTEKAVQKMAPEINKVISTQGKESQLRYFFQTILTFFQSKDKKSFISNFTKQPYAYNVSNRFVAWKAIQMGMLSEAVEIFTASKEEYKSRDLLVLFDLLCKINRCNEAYPHFIRNVDIIMPNWKRQVLRNQYNSLKKRFGEKVVPEEIAVQVEERLVIDPNPPGPGGSPNPCLKEPN